MTQRSLFIGAFALVLALGGLLVVSDQRTLTVSADTGDFDPTRCEEPDYRAEHTADCQELEEGGEDEETPDDELVTPDPSDTGDPVGAPLPAFTFKPDGKAIALVQLNHRNRNQQIVDSTTPLRIDKLRTIDFNKYGKLYDLIFTTKLTGNDIRSTYWAKATINLVAEIHSTNDQNGYSSTRYQGGIADAAALKNHYVISQPFATRANLTDWREFTFRYVADDAEHFQAFYRISNKDFATPEKDTGWVKIKNLKYGGNKARTYRIKDLKKDGKYFQFKFLVEGSDKLRYVDRVGVIGQPLKKVSLATPTAKPSATPSAGDDDGQTGEGRLTIFTRRIFYGNEAPEATPTPLPTSQLVLPNITPSAAVTARPSTDPQTTTPPTPAVLDQCAKVKKNEDLRKAPEVGFSLKQLADKGINLKDEDTGSEAVWKGRDNKIEKFPVDDYEVTFDEYQKSELILVAFCDWDGKLYKGANLKDRKAKLKLTKNQVTQLVALYAPRTTPFLTMEKYAFSTEPAAGTDIGKLTEMRLVYPGQKFVYYLTYENTGGEKATDVLIQDVVPAKYTIDLEKLLSDKRVTVEKHSSGGSLVRFQAGEVAAGQKAALTIPVTLPANAFSQSQPVE